MGKVNLHNTGKKMGKHRDFPYSALPCRFRVDENPWNSQCLVMYRFPPNGHTTWNQHRLHADITSIH